MADNSPNVGAWQSTDNKDNKPNVGAWGEQDQGVVEVTTKFANNIDEISKGVGPTTAAQLGGLIIGG